jgi:membrane protein YqaA with SNARE-associated domain
MRWHFLIAEKIFALPLFRWLGPLIGAARKQADSPRARLTLYVYSALESVIIPIPTDPLLVACVAAARQRWLELALLTAAASVVGGLIGWLLGIGMGAALTAMLTALPGIDADAFERVALGYQKLGLILVFIGAFTPLPYKVIAVSAGLFGYGLVPFLLISAVGRSLRFLLVAGLVRFYRDPKIVAGLSTLLGGLIVLGLWILQVGGL